MEYLFIEAGVENGHVTFKTERRAALIEVSEGRGSATRTHQFRIDGEIPPPQYDTNSATNLCRIAIAKFLTSRGTVASMSYIDERAEPWQGQMEKLG